MRTPAKNSPPAPATEANEVKELTDTMRGEKSADKAKPDLDMDAFLDELTK